MKISTLLIALLLTITGFSQQTGEVVIFENGGYQFHVILNGIKQNTKAESNIRIQSLRPTFYSCKVLADDNTFSIDKNIIVKSDTLITYQIVNKRGKFKLRFHSEVPLNTVQNSTTQSTITFHSEEYVPTNTAVVTPVEGNTTSMEVNTSVGGTEGMTSETVSTHTTTTTTETRDGMSTNTSVGTGDGNISISMDVSGTGANIDVQGSGLDGQEGMDMQMTGSETYTESTVTTTTTTTTSGNWTTTNTESSKMNSDTDIDVSQGFSDFDSGDCYVGEDEFTRFNTLFRNETFDDDKTAIATEFVQNKCLSVANIGTLMDGLTFSDDRMAVAKAAYATCYDSTEYYQLLEKFEFDVDQEELQTFINNQ